MRSAAALALLVCGAIWGQPRIYQVLDIEAVRSEGDPGKWVHHVSISSPPEITCDILIAGAGVGGFAAALLAADRGNSVCLTDETRWIGGQLTSGGVSALDEHRFMELAGGTRSYYQMRRGIREYYRRHFTLSPGIAQLADFNPGSCYVSPLCFEPKAGLAVLRAMLESRRKHIRTFLRTRLIELQTHGSTVDSALAYRFDSRDAILFRPKFVLDATESGDLLPLARVPYVIGSESKDDTNEPDAGPSPNPGCVQSFTYPFALEWRPGEEHRAPKPVDYEMYLRRQGFSLLVNYPEAQGFVGNVQYTMFGEDPPIPNNQSPRSFFAWRRLLARKNFSGPNAPHDVALINWPRQDYAAESILDREPLETARILQRAKAVSLAFLYWLQNDVHRDDGKGSGYPELMLRKDVMGTEDGLSMAPYIRESRRLRARGRVVEQDIGAEFQSGSRAGWFDDSVGTGFYMVDIHPCGAGERGRMMMPRPFQIPMSALIPRGGLTNFLAAGKNIGVTHITNGAFRLHPVEWNIGEAAAMIASLAIRNGAWPAALEVQRELIAAGVPLVWFDDLSSGNANFAAVQLTAINKAYPLDTHNLHASLDSPVTRAEAAQALAAVFGKTESRPSAALDIGKTNLQAAAIAVALDQGWMSNDHRNWFHPDLPFYWTDWREQRFPHALRPFKTRHLGPVTRREFAQRLMHTWESNIRTRAVR